MWVERPRGRRVYFELYYIVIYLVANVVMVICYIKIFRTAKSRVNVRTTLMRVTMLNMPPAVNSRQSEPLHKLHDKTLTKMTLVIVSTFMTCWGPHACVSIIIMANGSTITLEQVQLCCLALAYSTTILHPMIYTFMRRNFRRTLMRKLQRRDTKIHPKNLPARNKAINYHQNNHQGNHRDQIKDGNKAGSSQSKSNSDRQLVLHINKLE